MGLCNTVSMHGHWDTGTQDIQTCMYDCPQLNLFPSLQYDVPVNLSGHKQKGSLHDCTESSFNCGYTMRTASALTSHVSWGRGKGGAGVLN